MDRRNWLKLSRKLVDVTDLDYTVNSVQRFMSQNNLAFYGEGVLSTTTYPNPFPVAINSGPLTGTVGKGIGYDPTGYQVRIDDLLGTFTIPAGDANFGRTDLLVVRYKAVGTTQIPEPDLPTVSIPLNLVDGYELAVVPGTPSGSPAYPTKGQFDIILAGLNVPQGTSMGSQVGIDLSVREVGVPLRSFFPVFKQEVATGVSNGVNTQFTLSATPYGPSSLLVTVDGVTLTTTEWTVSGTTLILNEAPAFGQSVYVWYVVNSGGSINPIFGTQETPDGLIDGNNATFNLSGHPVDQNSLQVFIDGGLEPISNWSLVQSPSLSQIVFGPDSIPAPGQSVYAFYLQNVTIGAAGPSSSAGTSGDQIQTEYPQLTASNITNGFVVLSRTPISPSEVLLDVIGGGAQAYGSDFTIVGNHLVWMGDLVSQLVENDKLRVNYEY